MRKEMNEKRILLICVFALFVITTLIGYFSVWTHDDFMTASGSIVQLMHNSLYAGNGRYIGNFLVDFMLPHHVADAVFRGMCMTLSVVLIAAIAGGLNLRAFAVSFALFAALGNHIYSQTVIWGHGFYNFYPPVVLLLAAVCLLKTSYSGHAVIRGIPAACLLISAGLCQQLFSENSTCLQLLIALIIFCVVVYRKKPKLPAAAFLFGSCVGAFLMFALPKIMNVSYKMDGYRGKGIGADSISDFAAQFLENLFDSTRTLGAMFVAWGLLSFVMISLLKTYTGDRKILRTLRPVFYVVFSVQPVFSLVYYCINGRFEHAAEGEAAIRFLRWDVDAGKIIDAAISVSLMIYLFAAVLFLLLYNRFRGNKPLYVCLALLCALSVGELLIITVMGSRCLFITASILSVLIVKLLNDENLLTLRLSYGAGAAGIVCILSILIIMSAVWRVNNVKMAYIREQLAEGKTTIEVIKLPFGRWIHNPDFSASNKRAFNQGNPDEMEFVFIDYDEYKSRP